MFSSDTRLRFTSVKDGVHFKGAVECLHKDTGKRIWIDVLPITRLTHEDAIKDAKIELKPILDLLPEINMTIEG